MGVEVKVAATDFEKLVEIIKDLPAEQIAEVVNFAEYVRAKQEKQKQQTQLKENDKPRIAGLNRGMIWYSEDFADPLPDDIWDFNKDDNSNEQTPETENK